MKKNQNLGFTLVELLGVVVIIAALSLLVFPMLMNQFKKNRKEISGVTKTLIEEAASTYVEANPNDYLKTNGNVYCLSIGRLVSNGYLNDLLKDPTTEQEIKTSYQIKISVSNRQFYFDYIADGTCNEIVL